MNIIRKISKLLNNQSSSARGSQTRVERQSDGLSDEEFREITDMTMGWSPANGIAPHPRLNAGGRSTTEPAS